MSFNRFQGDPAIKITESGATMKFVDGQPVMDQGLHNAAIISVATKRGYWGNALTQDENEKIGSDYEQERIIVDVQTINETTTDLENALQWFKDTGLASTIDVESFNPSGIRIDSSAVIKSPGADALELLFIQNGLNWIAQAKNPAHERF